MNIEGDIMDSNAFGLVIQNPARLAEFIERAVQSDDINPMRSLLCTIHSLCRNSCEDISGMLINSENRRVLMYKGGNPGEIQWSKQIHRDGAYNEVMYGGLNRNTADGTFSLNT